jgi:hypothetical protein
MSDRRIITASREFFVELESLMQADERCVDGELLRKTNAWNIVLDTPFGKTLVFTYGSPDAAH